MIITTTPNVEGRTVIEYKGIVFGEVISGVDFIKDFAAGLTNFFGGRSGSYEGELIEAREAAIREMEKRITRFNWGEKIDDHKIHTMSFKQLCRPKS